MMSKDEMDPVKDEELEYNTDSEGTEDASNNVQSEDKEEKRSKKSIISEILVYAIILVLCVTVVPEYVVQRTIVDGPSMMNTLKDKENVLVEKVSYRFSDPERFDVIVFYPFGRENSDYYIKRVIGLPGETIQIVGNDILINGNKIKEHFGKDPMTFAGIAENPIKLGKDEFFVLGDNREVSEDSRYEEVGVVKKKNIEGQAILRIYPFSKFGSFD